MITIEIGYKTLVMNKEDAMMMIGVLERAEIYNKKYWSDEDKKARGMDSNYTHHVYPNDTQYSMHILTDDIYRMAKLAGKPPEKS
jgi:hypothetical protein